MSKRVEVSRVLFESQFGSHIYGTNLPTSDQDFKGIFVPSARDILLQKAGITSLADSTKEDSHAKNTTDDVDTELYTLQGFIRLCAEGQTAAVDMLFTPKSFWKSTSREWQFIQENRNMLVHSGVSAFVGYCQTQAAKYGIKGSRVAAVKAVIDFLSPYPNYDVKLFEIWPEVLAFVEAHQADKFSGLTKEGLREKFIKITMCQGPNSKLGDVPHLDVCNRKIPIHVTIKYALQTLQKIWDNYGHRAKQAESNEGIDWKALMHAVRVCGEAKELLLTGSVTFPRPEAPTLLKIRQGLLPYAEVAEMIEAGVQDVSELQPKSLLPKAIDMDFWNSFLLDVYGQEVILAH